MFYKISLVLFLLILGQNCFPQNLSKYELNTILFEGNKEFSSATLKEIILSKESPFWGWKFLHSVVTKYGRPPAYLDTTYFYVDLIAMENFYKANGFFKASFTNRYELDTLNNSAEIIYGISEGPPFLYGKTRFLGLEKSLPNYLYAEIIDRFGTDSTERFEQQKIESNINGTLNYLFNNGYMKAAYDSSIIFIDTSLNKTNIDIYFNPGKRYKINDIEVVKKGEGQTYVSDILIKEIIGISSDEYYNREKLRTSQNRLSKTGLFNSIKLEGYEKDSLNIRIPLRFEGVIGNMNELSPELVMDNDQNSFNFGLGGNFIRRNFLGDARKLTLGSKIGIIDIFHFNFANLFRRPERRDTTFQGYIDLNMKIEQPYVFSRPILGTLEGYLKTRTEYQTNITTYGSKLSFDFELPEHTFINQLRSYYNLESYGLEYNKPISSLKLQFNSITSLIGGEFASINSNDIFFPTKGFNLSFLLEGGISNTSSNVTGNKNDIDSLISTLNVTNAKLNVDEKTIFYKTQVTATSFFALNYTQNAVFAVKTRIGYIQTIYGGDNLIPPNRTFNTGGSNSVRGWRARQLVPDDTVSFFSLDIGDNVRGGTFLFEGSFEYRKRFFDNLGIALFSDYGNTWNGYKGFRIDKIALAAGFGFRYYSSIAPFRLDFGFKLYDPSNKMWLFDRRPFKTLEIHFGIGEAF